VTMREANHGRDFNGVCCRRLVGNMPNIFKELRALMRTKKDDSCEDSLINEKLEKIGNDIWLAKCSLCSP
jgi:hypothetical protein